MLGFLITGSQSYMYIMLVYSRGEFFISKLLIWPHSLILKIVACVYSIGSFFSSMLSKGDFLD